tara:strand:- start:182 stop:2410 length:2229 start_codon:yes stop_codon:yes gene_type:complete
MATEEIYMSIKTDVKSASQDTKQYAKTLEQAKGNVKELNDSLAAQNKYIFEQEKELNKLKQIQDSIPKGAWDARQPKLTEEINRLTGSIRNSKIELKGLKIEQKEAAGVVKEYNQAQKEQSDTLLEDIKNYKVFGVSINGIGKAFGKIVPAAKLAFSTITKGLIATGIGAFVVALGAITLWFTKTKVGAEALTKIFAGFGAAISVVVDRITGFVSAVGKLFTGDISGGLSAMKDSFVGIGDEIARETRAAIELKEALNRLADAERQLNVETAQRRADIEELKLAADDMTLSADERIQKLHEAGEIEQNLNNQRIANAEEAVRIQQEQMAMSKNMKADLQALADLEINLANVRRDSAKVTRTIQRKENSIRRQQRAQERAAHKKFIQRQNERIRAQNNTVQSFNKLYQEEFKKALKSDQLREKFEAELRFKAREKEINETVFNEEKKEQLIKDNFTFFESEKQDIRLKYKKMREERDDEEKAQLLAREQENTLAIIENERERYTQELDFQEKAEIASVANLKNKEQQEEEIREKYRLLRKEKREQEAEEDKQLAEQVAQVKGEILANSLAAIAGALQFQMNALEQQKNKEIKLAEAQGKSTEKIEKKYERKRIALAKKTKALKIGQAMIDTFSSGISAYNSAMQLGPPGLALAPIAAAAAVAAGLANVAIISQQDVGGGSGGGGGGGGGMPSAGAQGPAPQMMSGAFELGEVAEPEPLQAFVVTDDMTNAQNQLANIRRRSTI